jgi:hypothetical protein
MRSLALLLLLASFPASAQQAPLGTVRAGRAAVEVLPARGAAEIRTPEGFIRAEGPALAAGAGTFGVYPAGSRMPPPPALLTAAARPQQDETAAPARPSDPCRPERSRYLRRLLYAIGIDLEDPIAFLDGLVGREGSSSGPLLFTAYGQLGMVDPIHPLAWDLELKSLARELAACQAAGAR